MWKKYCNRTAHAALRREKQTGQALRAVLLVLLLLTLLSAGCATRKPGAVSPPPHEERFSLVDGKELPDQELAQLAGNADYVLIGEQHNNAAHHKAQAALLGLLAREKHRPVLGLEMLPRRQYTEVLQDFSAGRLPLRDLPEALNWRENWGYPFALYEPVFAVALDNGLPIYGLNVPNDLRKKVSRKGLEALTPTERAALPARIIPPLPEQREELAAFFLQHNAMRRQGMRPGSGPEATTAVTPAAAAAARTGLTNDNRLVASVTVQGVRQGLPAKAVLPVSLAGPFERFLLIQSIWDSIMAEEAIVLRRRYSASGPDGREPAGPIVLLAGAGHVEHGLGIAHRLRLLDPGARILTVLPGGDPAAGPVAELGAADVFYYSPKAPRPGYGLTFALADQALRITDVAPGSPAAGAGIAAGDRVLRAGKLPVSSPADLHTTAHEAAQKGQPLTLLLEREGKQFTAVLPRRGE